MGIVTKRDLKKHLKKRVGSDFRGASKEILDLFDVGLISLEKRKNADIFAATLRYQILPNIENRSIISIERLDEIIDEGIGVKKDVFNTINSFKGVTYTIIRRRPPTVVDVTYQDDFTPLATAVIGNQLSGPAVAAFGYNMAKENSVQVKQEVIKNEHTYPKSYVQILDNKINVIHEKMDTWFIPFEKIISFNFFEKQNAFQVETVDETIFVFKCETNRLFDTRKLFYKLENKIMEYNSRFCSNCGYPLEKGANFCGECGHKIKNV